MGKVWTYSDRVRTLNGSRGDEYTISFEEGKTYYIIDSYPYRIDGKYHSLPIVVKIVPEEADFEEEGVEFYLRSKEHLFPSDLPLGGYEHPNEINPDEWDDYYFDTLEGALDALYKKFDDDRIAYFRGMFEGV